MVSTIYLLVLNSEMDHPYPDKFKKYQTQVRVSAAQRWEANRRAGGRKTQKSVAKSWQVSRITFVLLFKILIQNISSDLCR